MTGSMLDAMHLARLAPVKDIELHDNGQLTRYRIQGDKPGSRNGWAVLHSHPVAAGAFGSWKTGESHTWRQASSQAQTPAERAAWQSQILAMQQTRATEQAAVHASARERAVKLWAKSWPAASAHPYLTLKRVQAYGVRQLRDMLVIPARDVRGTLHTLQFISADGSKRFLTGGRITGCYHAIGKPFATLLLAEGFATASTLHQATGEAVAACFNCGNLLAVARALRDKYPRLRLVVCADNDQATPGNPGVTHARAAAVAVGGFLAVPAFAETRP